MIEALVALAAVISVAISFYLFGFFKSLRAEFEREAKYIQTHKKELQEAMAKLADTHNQLMVAQQDMGIKLSAFEMHRKKM